MEVPLVRCRFKVLIVVKNKYGMGMNGMVIKYGKLLIMVLLVRELVISIET